MAELKRRDMSGIYIRDKFPGEMRMHPTCIEDCQQSTRRAWCMKKSQECLHNVIEMLSQTLKSICDYLMSEGCVTEEQRDGLMEMINRNVENSKYNLAVHELAVYVDFFCEKLVMLTDACGVVKAEAKEDDK